MNEKMYNVETHFPNELSTDRLMRERDKLWNVIEESAKAKYINFSAIVSRYNIICHELHRRGVL